jgi:uncharacterized glyoxalase superfamily protein PhnB
MRKSARNHRGDPSPSANTQRHKEQIPPGRVLFRATGATIVKAAQDTFYGGYAGYFQDLDGHLWEIAFNPAMLPPE